MICTASFISFDFSVHELGGCQQIRHQGSRRPSTVLRRRGYGIIYGDVIPYLPDLLAHASNAAKFLNNKLFTDCNNYSLIVLNKHSSDN